MKIVKSNINFNNSLFLTLTILNTCFGKDVLLYDRDINRYKKLSFIS